MIFFVFQLSFVAEKVEQVDGKVQTRKLSKDEEIKLDKFQIATTNVNEIDKNILSFNNSCLIKNTNYNIF